MSRAGIQHALTAAQKTADVSEAATLRSSAKALAFNLASFTWPGWDEKDFTSTASDMAVGLDAAQLNLRLAEELNKPEKAKANAWWVLGAHQLAAGKHQLAIDAFLTGKSHAAAADNAVVGHMLDGYAAMALILASPGDAPARAEFDCAVAALMADRSDDAKGYADQLLNVLAYFQR